MIGNGKLPRTVSAPGGPVSVRIKRGLRFDGKKCWGIYQPEHRRILIEQSAAMEQRWRVLYHEIAHVWMMDSGLDNQFSEEGSEAIADAISTGLVRLVEGHG